MKQRVIGYRKVIVSINLLSNKVHVFIGGKPAYDAFVRLCKKLNPGIDIAEECDPGDAALCCGGVIWLSGLSTSSSVQIGYLVHETVHCVSSLMKEYGITGDESRAYMTDFIVRRVLESTRRAEEKEKRKQKETDVDNKEALRP